MMYEYFLNNKKKILRGRDKTKYIEIKCFNNYAYMHYPDLYFTSEEIRIQKSSHPTVHCYTSHRSEIQLSFVTHRIYSADYIRTKGHRTLFLITLSSCGICVTPTPHPPTPWGCTLAAESNTAVTPWQEAVTIPSKLPIKL